MKRALVITAKSPELGKSKTRLAETIGLEKALTAYLKMLDKTFDLAAELAIDTRVYFSEKNDYTDAFERFPYFFQSSGSIGDRMRNALKESFDVGYDELILIGSDCPDNYVINLRTAIDKLNEHDVVFGPSEDGGYYLIAMKVLHDTLFEGITWSTDKVLKQSLEKANASSLSVGFCETLNDIDYYSDYMRSEYFKKIEKKL